MKKVRKNNPWELIFMENKFTVKELIKGVNRFPLALLRKDKKKALAMLKTLFKISKVGVVVNLNEMNLLEIADFIGMVSECLKDKEVFEHPWIYDAVSNRKRLDASYRSKALYFEVSPRVDLKGVLGSLYGAENLSGSWPRLEIFRLIWGGSFEDRRILSPPLDKRPFSKWSMQPQNFQKNEIFKYKKQK